MLRFRSQDLETDTSSCSSRQLPFPSLPPPKRPQKLLNSKNYNWSMNINEQVLKQYLKRISNKKYYEYVSSASVLMKCALFQAWVSTYFNALLYWWKYFTLSPPRENLFVSLQSLGLWLHLLLSIASYKLDTILFC